LRAHTRLAVGLLLGFLVAPVAGCSGQSKEKPVFKVRGRLTHDGKPMARAMISYYSVDAADRGTPSHATSDAGGRYELHTYREGDGAPAGEYVVTIFWPGPRAKKDKAADPTDPEAETSTPDRLKGQYAQAGKSKLRATVREQDNEIGGRPER
jgi:hypothetical protein